MLVRILTDNPGPSFTRNMDAKFVATVKELLKTGRDPGVQRILRETLDNFEREKVSSDENLTMLIEMWKKEQVKLSKMYPNGVPAGLQGRVLNAPGWNPHSQNYFSRNHNSRSLPPPDELSSRIEEARTSAKLLGQVVQSTPPSELLQSELIKEFSDRCQSASRSIQKYMHCEPGPDNDTMLTLIETNDQLSMAMSQHQRAVLQARKTLGLSAATPPNAGTPSNGGLNPFAPPPGPPPSQTTGPAVPSRKNLAPKPTARSNRSDVSAASSDSENPFNDPAPAGPSVTKTHNPPFPEDKKKKGPAGKQEERLGIEPYHPGFNATASFNGRQNSAVEGMKMSSAIPERARERDSDDDSDDDEDDRYRGETPKKAPVYRY